MVLNHTVLSLFALALMCDGLHILISVTSGPGSSGATDKFVKHKSLAMSCISLVLMISINAVFHSWKKTLQLWSYFQKLYFTWMTKIRLDMLIFYFVEKHWLCKYTCHKKLYVAWWQLATIKTTKNDYMNSVWLFDKQYLILEAYTLSIF